MNDERDQRGAWPGAFELPGIDGQSTASRSRPAEDQLPHAQSEQTSPGGWGIILAMLVAGCSIVGAMAWVMWNRPPAPGPGVVVEASPKPIVTEEEISKLRAALDTQPGSHPFLPELSQGAVGLVRDARIIQVLGPHACLASVTTGESSVHFPELERHNTVLLQGYPTSDRVDGDRIAYLMPVKVVGRQSYEAAMGGSRTVWVLLWIHEAFEKAPAKQ